MLRGRCLEHPMHSFADAALDVAQGRLVVAEGVPREDRALVHLRRLHLELALLEALEPVVQHSRRRVLVIIGAAARHLAPEGASLLRRRLMGGIHRGDDRRGHHLRRLDREHLAQPEEERMLVEVVKDLVLVVSPGDRQRCDEPAPPNNTLDAEFADMAGQLIEVALQTLVGPSDVRRRPRRLAIVELAEQQRQCIHARALVGVEMDDEPLREVPVRLRQHHAGMLAVGAVLLALDNGPDPVRRVEQPSEQLFAQVLNTRGSYPLAPMGTSTIRTSTWSLAPSSAPRSTSVEMLAEDGIGAEPVCSSRTVGSRSSASPLSLLGRHAAVYSRLRHDLLVLRPVFRYRGPSSLLA